MTRPAPADDCKQVLRAGKRPKWSCLGYVVANGSLEQAGFYHALGTIPRTYPKREVAQAQAQASYTVVLCTMQVPMGRGQRIRRRAENDVKLKVAGQLISRPIRDWAERKDNGLGVASSEPANFLIRQMGWRGGRKGSSLLRSSKANSNRAGKQTS